jgi:putative nucleotidyltransferase with HDIG domain
MVIPDISSCIDLMEKYRMLDNIRHHSIVVARIADILVTELARHNKLPFPERPLVLAGALLHDIAKTPCLKSDCEHAAHGAAICREHGYMDIAKIVEEHVILKDFDPDRYEGGGFTAAEIVYYADKRVTHKRIVSLSQRLEYILGHYGRNDEKRCALIYENFKRCLHLEKALFSFLPFPTGKIEEMIVRGCW